MQSLDGRERERGASLRVEPRRLWWMLLLQTCCCYWWLQSFFLTVAADSGARPEMHAQITVAEEELTAATRADQPSALAPYWWHAPTSLEHASLTGHWSWSRARCLAYLLHSYLLRTYLLGNESSPNK